MAQLRHTIVLTRKDTNTSWPDRPFTIPGAAGKYEQTIGYSDDELVMTITRVWQDQNDWKDIFVSSNTSIDAADYISDLELGLTLSITLERI